MERAGVTPSTHLSPLSPLFLVARPLVGVNANGGASDPELNLSEDDPSCADDALLPPNAVNHIPMSGHISGGGPIFQLPAPTSTGD